MVDHTVTPNQTRQYNAILLFEDGSIKIPPGQIRQLYIIEDITSFCITGKILFFDTMGLYEEGPFTSTSQLVIEFTTENDSRRLLFEIQQVSKVTQSNPTEPVAESMIEIYFIDPSYNFMKERQYSKSWSETLVSDIVDDILQKMCGNPQKDRWEITSNKIDFLMPYYTPMESIRWLSKAAVGNISKTPGYTYFNNIRNSEMRANWLSIDSLFSETSKYIDELVFLFETGNMYYRNKILDWYFTGVDKMSFKTLRGANVYGYDFLTKSLLKSEHTYSGTIGKINIMGNYSLFMNISDSSASHIRTAENTSTELETTYIDEFIRKYTEQNTLNIIVPGYEDRYAGQQIDIEWPTNIEDVGFNKLLMGKYLIKSVTNILINGDEPYKQKLELIKNGYESIDSKYVVKATKKNLARGQQR